MNPFLNKKNLKSRNWTLTFAKFITQTKLTRMFEFSSFQDTYKILIPKTS